MCMYVHRMGERGRGRKRERERAHVHHLHKRVLTELFHPPCRQIQKKMLAKQFQHSSKYQGGLPGKFGSFVPDVS